MSQMRDNAVPYGKSAEEIIADAVKNYKYPVLFGFPAGHINDNMPIILGREAVLDVAKDSSGLIFTQSQNTNQKGKVGNLVKPVLFITAFFALIWLLYFFLLGNQI
jgi:muramoyltetrapeptide carboxypeptidase